MLAPMLNMVDITGMRVPVADDVADTGKTLELVHRLIECHVSEAHCTPSRSEPV